MKMKIVTSVVLISLAITSCNFSKSIKKDLVSGLLTTGDGLTCDNVYLTVNDKNSARTTFIYGEEFLMNFSNIGGFKKENENVFPGLSLKATDKAGNLVLDFNDLFADYSQSGLAVPDFKARVSSHFKLTGSDFKNPLHCELIIWDKKSDARIKASADLIIE